MYIDSYHTMKNDNDYTFFGNTDRNTALHMGFELEVDLGEVDDNDDDDYDAACRACDDCTDDLARIALSTTNGDDFLHFEEDGSLDNGFEIITQPASVDFHIAQFAPDGLYTQLCDTCRSYGFKSHDAKTCGFHIHLDKEYFSDCLDSASAKLLFLFERHWDNLMKFSRRRSDRWCQRYESHAIARIIKDAKCGDIGRYYAVNLSNDNTIEIRLWRGTLNPATLLATIKLTARLAALAKETSAVKLAAMSWEDVLGDDPDILTYWNLRNNH